MILSICVFWKYVYTSAGNYFFSGQFGSPPQAGGFGSFNAFGAPAAAPAQNAFGAPAAAPAQNSFDPFGSSAPQPTQQSQPSFAAFGAPPQQQQQPAPQPQQQTNLFDAFGSPPSSSGGGFNAFGASPSSGLRTWLNFTSRITQGFFQATSPRH